MSLVVALFKNSSLQDVWTRWLRFAPVALGPRIVPQCYPIRSHTPYSHVLFQTCFLGIILKCTSQMGSYNFRHLELAPHSTTLAALSQGPTWRPWLQVDTAHCPGGTNVEQPACQPTPPGSAWRSSASSVSCGHCWTALFSLWSLLSLQCPLSPFLALSSHTASLFFILCHL